MSNSGFAITGYVVAAMRVNSAGTVIRTTLATTAASARSLTMTLPAGIYQFAVRARNINGLGAYSSRSQLVNAR